MRDIFSIPGLRVYIDECMKVEAKGRLSFLLSPVIKKMNERLSEEKPAAVLEDGSVVASTWLPPIPSKAFSRLIKAEFKRVLGRPIPTTLSIEVTGRCRCKCKHCTVAGSEEPPLENLLDIIDQALKLGTCIITLTEGDPLLRKDIIEIVDYVDDRAIVNMFTPATDLTPDAAKKLKMANLHNLLISLYSTVPQKHDYVRGLEGAYEMALNGIRNGLKAGLLVTLSTHIGHSTMNELRPLYELARSLGVHEFSVWESIHDPPTNEDRREILKMYSLVNKTREGPRMFASTRFEGIDFGCLGGTRWAHVGVDGGLRPCPYVPVSYGNVYEEGLEKVWRKLSSFREKIKGVGVCPMQNIEFVNRIR